MSEQTLFAEALERTDPRDRAAFLDQACQDDPVLRARVERLLAQHQHAGAFLENSPRAAESPKGEQISDSPGAIIGPYKLIEQIGEGGMGNVWMAQQIEPVKRLVAIKLIKAGMDSKNVVARFEAERQALALMDHINIARVLDAGTTGGGRPYFVMDLVKGVPITKYCDERCLTTRQRLELFMSVCQAVQHAHQKGIIHRDLKPSNVLVALYDDKPVVKVIDFGVAKAAGQPLTERTLLTGFGAIVGTLEYMSPEQAEFNQLDIDTRSDIYSLGVMLYELLAGSPPFTRNELRQAGVLEMLRVIREQEPSKPSTRLSTSESIASIASQRHTEPGKLSKLMCGDLDWITLKCLEKDRTRRYDTANSLAQDIQHYLNDEPVEASPPSPVYRFSKFVRRNKVPVTAASLTLLVLMAGIVGTTWGLLRADQDRRRAERALAAETQARAAERQARDRAVAALRSMTDEIMQNRMAQDVYLSDEDKEYLRKIVEHFEGFAAIRSNDTESRAIRAEGYAEVGVIWHRLGELKEAESALVDSVSILEQLAAEFPERPRFRQELARSQCNLGILLRTNGRFTEAEAAFADAQAILTQLTSDFPTHPEFRENLAQNNNNLGNLLNTMGRLNEAEAAYANALATQKRLAAEFPNRPDFRRHLATNHSNLGDLLRVTGRLKDAEASFAKALAIRKQLASEFPTRPEFQQELAGSHNNLGILLRATGRWKEAEAAYAAALAIHKQLSADFPAVPEFRLHLSMSENNIARLFADTGRPKDAEIAYGEALAIQTRLVADFPTRPEFRLQMARSRKNLGSLLEDANRFEEAEAAFNSALSISKQLTSEFPSSLEFRQELAGTYNNLGVLFRVTGRLTEADAAFADALAIKTQLTTEFPNQPDLRHSLAGTLLNLAILCDQRRDFQAAKKCLEQAQPHLQAAVHANPQHPDYRESYHNNLLALVGANTALNDHQGASRAAEMIHNLGWDPPTDAYHAACALAQCIPNLEKREQLDEAKRKEAAQRYGDQALAMLRDAISKGWNDADCINKDSHLDPLRNREEFREMLKELKDKSK